MKPFQFWLKADRFIPVRFYGYTSIVCNTIWEQSHNYKSEEHDMVQAFADIIEAKALALGAIWDNKVVVEIQYQSTANQPEYVMSNLFVGYKDGRIVIGLGVWMADRVHGGSSVVDLPHVRKS